MIKSYEAYVFLLCAIVFVAFTALFSVLIYNIVKLTVRLIRAGVEDERILKEALHKKPKNKIKERLSKITSFILFVIIITFFIFSLLIQVTQDFQFSSVLPKVVKSASMSYKNEKNSYLIENNLNDQFNTFDLIFTQELPNEFDLKLYDIVIYEYKDMLVIHRIVKIEEPNSKHPNSRLFIFQGDAVRYPDANPVTYDQMKAIYRGDRVPYVGSFVFFMQSPAGWLCIMLILSSLIATPIVEKKIQKETQNRLAKINNQNQ